MGPAKTLLMLLFLLSFKNIQAQDSSLPIQEAWTKLKTQIQRRTDIVINLATIANKSKYVDDSLITNSKMLATDLFRYVDTMTVKDSLSVNIAGLKNANLQMSIAGILIRLENDIPLRKKDNFTSLIAQLEGCETRLHLAIGLYNDICTAYNRTDLLFGKEQTEKNPDVKF